MLKKSDINRIKRVGKRILKERCISLAKRFFAEKSIVKNVFNSDFERYVLVSGFPEFLISSSPTIPKWHSIFTENYIILKIFHELGFQVDCIDGKSEEKIEFGKYEVVMVGMPLLSQIWTVNPDVISLYYTLGCHPFFAAKYSTDRLREKEKCYISSIRYFNVTNLHLIFTTHVIVLGNQFTLNTYLAQDPQKERYSNLPAFFFNAQEADLKHKEYKNAQKNFLWFGGTGLVHKGLDICIDIFLQREDINLHICGAPRKEKEFWDYYDPLIKGRNNIVIHGFVDIESKEFKKILSQCGFAIYPSVSEGGAVALLNVVGNGGLIPIYSKSTGVDFEEFGIEVPEVKIELFENAIESALTFTEEEMKRRSLKGYNEVRENYTIEKYEENLKNIIIGVLESKKNIITLSSN